MGGVRPAVALPAVGDPGALGQAAEQVDALPDGVPGGAQLALDEGADLLLRPGGAGVVTGHRGRQQSVVERRVGGRSGRRAVELAARVAARLGELGGPLGRYTGRRGDPGEQRAQVLVLQGALAGRPVAGQELRQGQQQAGARHPGPLAEVREPAAQQRHVRRRGEGRLRLLLGRPPEPHRAAQQAHVLDAGGARHDQLGCVGAQFDLDRDLLAGLRVGLLALLELDVVGEAVHVGQHRLGQVGEEGEPQVTVPGLGDRQQQRLLAVGADQGAQRGAGLTGGGQRDEDQRAGGEVAVADRGPRLGAAGCRRLHPGQRLDQ